MNTQPPVQTEPFGNADGQPVQLYTLTNVHGLSASITNYGGILSRLIVPDRAGQLSDIVLGFDTIEEYGSNSAYLGALIGRYGNRIADAKFTLDGETYHLSANNGKNCLHSGPQGFHNRLWQADPLATDTGAGLSLSLTSPDGEGGFPGTLSVRVTYMLTNENELRIDYEAETDKATPVALTHHGYFNLSGDLGAPITDHLLHVDADDYTPVYDDLIPTGEIAPVSNTPFDFRQPALISDSLAQDNEQLSRGGGIDHNLVLGGNAGDLREVASVSHPGSGRVMRVLTTEPGMQVYTGNFLGDNQRGKGAVFGRHCGLALETQHFPDSPNQPAFPSTILRPGERLRSTTIYRFETGDVQAATGEK